MGKVKTSLETVSPFYSLDYVFLSYLSILPVASRFPFLFIVIQAAAVR